MVKIKVTKEQLRKMIVGTRLIDDGKKDLILNINGMFEITLEDAERTMLEEYIKAKTEAAPKHTAAEYKDMIDNCDSLIDNAESFRTGKKDDDAIWDNDIVQLKKIKEVLLYLKKEEEQNAES